MVERTEAQGFDTFEGQVESVEREPSSLEGVDQEQYHIQIKPLNVEISGKTGFIHEWVRISAKTTDTSVPEGGVLDKYLGEIEVLFREAKKLDSHAEVFALLTGNSFSWVKKKLGKAYDGNAAKEYWAPNKII